MDILEFYASQSPFTDPGDHVAGYEDLPKSADGIVKVVQGVMLDFMDRWKHPIQNERWLETSIRYVDEMIEAVRLLDKKAPLTQEHEPVCKMMASPSHFAALTVSMLRHVGIPARKREGYVPSGEFFKEYGIEDVLMTYAVVEYFDAASGEWKVADPAGRGEGFISAAQGYKDARAKKIKSEDFYNDENSGMDVVVSVLINDLCAVTKHEVLSWDRFGWGRRDVDSFSDRAWAILDETAELLAEDDKNVDALVAMYDSEEGLQVPRILYCDSPLVPPHEMVTRVTL